MKNKFSIKFLEDAIDFIENLDAKSRDKVIYNLNLSSRKNDKNLFKKLTENIWEFRTLYNKQTLRLFAFWDKRDKEDTLVICTHGLLKKTKKIPKNEIRKAEEIRVEYFTIKISKNEESEKVEDDES